MIHHVSASIASEPLSHADTIRTTKPSRAGTSKSVKSDTATAKPKRRWARRKTSTDGWATLGRESPFEGQSFPLGLGRLGESATMARSGKDRRGSPASPAGGQVDLRRTKSLAAALGVAARRALVAAAVRTVAAGSAIAVWTVTTAWAATAAPTAIVPFTAWTTTTTAAATVVAVFQVAHVFNEVRAVFHHVAKPATLRATATTIATTIMARRTVVWMGLVAFLATPRTQVAPTFQRRRQKLTRQLRKLDAFTRCLPQKFAVQAPADLDRELAALRLLINRRRGRLALRREVCIQGCQLLLDVEDRLGAGHAFRGAVRKLGNARRKRLALAIERENRPIVRSRHSRFPLVRKWAVI